VDFGFWGSLLAFWWLWIDLTKFLGCFVNILGQTLVENRILGEKTKDLVFPTTIVAGF
jgi:hypothetical protein